MPVARAQPALELAVRHPGLGLDQSHARGLGVLDEVLAGALDGLVRFPGCNTQRLYLGRGEALGRRRQHLAFQRLSCTISRLALPALGLVIIRWPPSAP